MKVEGTKAYSDLMMPVTQSGPTEASFKKVFAQVTQDQDEQKLRQACQDLESLLWGQVLSAMRATVPRSYLFGRSFGEEVFESMLDEEYSRNLSKSQITGLADLLFQQLRSR